MSATATATGIDRLLDDPAPLAGARVGLLANQASVTADGRPTVLALREAGVDLRLLLGFEHGWSGFEADAAPQADARDPWLGLPLHSLYGPRRRPDPDALRAVDVVLVDVRDAGARCYTYASTVALLLEAAATAGTRVLLCDRPNPQGGRLAGPMLEPAYRSFLGYLPVPLQHGLTVGELARVHASGPLAGNVELEVVPVPGWRRDAPRATARGAAWVPPSPGLPTREAAWLYPGLVLLEGTPFSEGRGTPLPFRVLGAPGLDPYALAAEVRALAPAGAWARPLTFRPESGPLAGRACGGVQLHVCDPEALDAFDLTVRLLARLRAAGALERWVDAAEMPWSAPGRAASAAEEPNEGPMVDWLAGSEAVRAVIDGRRDASAAREDWRAQAAAFVAASAAQRLYDPAPAPS